jgi:hypothetical protein
MPRRFASTGGNTGLSESGSGLSLLSLEKAPGTIPPTVNPPRGPVTAPDQPFVASLTPASSSEPATRVASVSPPGQSAKPQNTQSQNTQPQSTQSEGFFASFARKVGLGGPSVDTTATATQPVPVKPKVADAKVTAPKPQAPKADTRQASAHPAAKPAPSDAAAPAAPASAPTATDGLVAGAQPIVSANSFESRFSAAK